MKRVRPMLATLACSLFLLSACAPASKLHVPGDIARPPFPGPLPAGPPRAVVYDFAYAPSLEGPDVIGHDFDRARPILWQGHPGKAMADLVAGSLSERGIPAVRRKAGDPSPENVSLLVSGTVRAFEVNVRRQGVLKVQSEAVVSLSVAVSGAGVAGPWETSVTSSTTMQDLFPVPEELQRVLQASANTAADEAVRRLREGGAAGAFPAGGAGGDGTSR